MISRLIVGLVVTSIGLVGCRPEATQPAESAADQAKSSVIILQCDGTFISELGSGSTEQRRTYEIDTENNTVRVWNATEAKWVKSSKDDEKVTITASHIQWDRSGMSDDGEVGSVSVAVFNRMLGTVTVNGSMIIDKIYEDRFVGKCIKVTEPNNETVF